MVLGCPDQERTDQLSPTGLSPSMVGLSRTVRLAVSLCNSPTLAALGSNQIPQHRPHNACRPYMQLGLGCFPFARRYSGNRGFFLFLGVLRCFSSPRSLISAYVFIDSVTRLYPAGFPHSEISGSKLVCSSPKLIAAYHVLHRLPTPRHPPSALSSLTQKSISKKIPACSYPDSVVKERVWLILPANQALHGGDNRARTGNLRLAKPALSQLSYIPEACTDRFQNLVGLGRVELPTSRLSGVRSNQLSYRPDKNSVGIWKEPERKQNSVVSSSQLDSST